MYFDNVQSMGDVINLRSRITMTARRADLEGLPDWPRGLSAEQAAAYVGVSLPTFLAEVARGKWPDGERRGPRGTRVVWDRRALDVSYDRASGLDFSDGPDEQDALARLG
jgi:hypothetical protein